MALKYLTIQFSNRIIGCKVLTIKQDLDFVKLLSSKLPLIRRFNFLFRASDHQYSGNKFHEYCDDKPGTISIINSNFGNIFGGYTSTSWKASKFGGYKTDKNAFLFLIKSEDKSIQNKCPLLLEMKKDNENVAIYCEKNHGPIFGYHDIVIRDKCNKHLDEKSNLFINNYSRLWSYWNQNCPDLNLCGGNIKDSNLCGGNIKDSDRYLFQALEYEVFHVIQ